MTIVRVNAAGFGIGDKLTSAQANGLDLNGTYAADKRSGQTDTIESVWTHSGESRIIQTVALGADSNTTYQANAANSNIRVTSAVTASRTYTLSATGAVTNDVMTVFCEPSFSSSFEVLIKDQASATMFILGNADSADGQWAQFIYIGGWRLFRGGGGSRARTEIKTSDGTWTSPRGVKNAIFILCGGGGGGAGGANFQVADTHACGGGGGGGAILITAASAVVEQRAHAYFIGTGGTGGAAANSGNNGSETSIMDNVTSDVLVTAKGAQGGSYGKGCTAGSGPNQITWGLGGSPCSSFGATPAMETTLANGAGMYQDSTPGRGGNGVTGNNSAYAQGGNDAPACLQQGTFGLYFGGAAGTCNTTSSGSYRGGGAGGGGGAGPFGSGGLAGNGGAPNNAGPAGNGTAGAAAGVNSGAGGGGGGASGGSTTSGTGGAGGAGGKGQLIILYVK